MVGEFWWSIACVKGLDHGNFEPILPSFLRMTALSFFIVTEDCGVGKYIETVTKTT